MRTFTKVAAQGEITIRRLGEGLGTKTGYTELKPEHGKFVIGHSETGHHHVLDRVEGVQVFTKDQAPEGMKVLYAILDEPTSLDHLRPHDTHESLLLEPGEYEFRIAREFDPYAELARISAD